MNKDGNRDYLPIWEQLKTHKKATTLAHPYYHARIIKAVKKEKWLDTLFRLEMLEMNPPMKVTMFSKRGSKANRHELTFRLVFNIHYGELLS